MDICSSRIGDNVRGCVVIALASLIVCDCARATLEVMDDSGRSVRLYQPARRIVTLAPHLAELVFDAGAGEQLIGVAAYSDEPAQARMLPRIGDARGLDLERIVRLRPDLVIAWGSGTPARQVERLRRLGYVIFVNEPRTLDAVATAIERIGVLAGTAGHAGPQAAAFRRRLSDLRSLATRERRMHVFYQVWGEPLLTVSGDHIIADALATCGADTLFADPRRRVSQPSREAVLLADPDAIVVAAAPGSERAMIERWQRWTRLRASRAERIYAVDPSVLHRHTPRILDGLERLCAQLRSVRGR